MADDMLVMNQGAIVERGDADAIYAAPQNEYTQKLLNAIPRGYTGHSGHALHSEHAIRAS
jgi:peptide/nickel transport system ATP-binding protein